MKKMKIEKRKHIEKKNETNNEKKEKHETHNGK